ncbi:MAG: META domain-containing protein [Candidatus Methanofastidiosia archaeon]|jgi:heat shock protein HslJ
MKRTLLLLLLVCILSSVVAGCISQESYELEGTLWKLDSYMNDECYLVSVLPHTEITAQFQGGRFNGNAGCNNYFGNYQISGNAITIGTVSSTRMYCEPAEIMEQEGGYLARFESASEYQIQGNTLKMTNAGGVVILIFTA